MVVRAMMPVPMTLRDPPKGVVEMCSAASAAEAAVRVALMSDPSMHASA